MRKDQLLSSEVVHGRSLAICEQLSSPPDPDSDPYFYKLYMDKDTSLIATPRESWEWVLYLYSVILSSFFSIFWREIRAMCLIDSSVVQRYNNLPGNYEYGVRFRRVGSFYGVGFFSLVPLSTGHNISHGPEWGKRTKFPSHCSKYGSLIIKYRNFAYLHILFESW
jgi:hypothetical protein